MFKPFYIINQAEFKDGYDLIYTILIKNQNERNLLNSHLSESCKSLNNSQSAILALCTFRGAPSGGELNFLTYHRGKQE